MKDRVAYQNGKWIPEDDAKVSIWNRGFTLGDAVYEAVRTFNMELFKNREHVDRLFRSMKVARMDIGMSPDELEAVTEELVERNRETVGEDGELFVYTYVSRGPGTHPLKSGPCELHIAVKEIDFKGFAKYYDTGVHLVVPSVRRQPPQVWDAKVKSTSRFTHTLADIEAYQVDPDAYCLMLDLDGNVAENRSAIFCLIRDGVIYAPQSTGRIQGISELAIKEVAATLKIPFVERDLQLYDVYNCDEAFLCSTSWLMAPASRLMGEPIGPDSLPGPVFRAIADGLSELTGVDFIAQAKRHAGIN